MAHSPHFLLIFLSLSFFILVSGSQSTSRPNNLAIPVRRDVQTNLHVTTIWQGTPKKPLHLVVDLNSGINWVNCEQNYQSSTYQAQQCHSTQCARANSQQCLQCQSVNRPGCHSNSCGVNVRNPISQQTALSELGQDVLSIQTIQGSNSGSSVAVPRFLFACAPAWLSQNGLPNYVNGVLGLGHTHISLPVQLGSNFGLRPNFAICLSSSPNNNGAILFGEGIFGNVPGVGASRPLGYTPLTISGQGEYRVGVTSININQKPIQLASGSTPSGFGGSMISTATPFTILEQRLYQAVIQAFTSQFPHAQPVGQVGQFGLCYNRQDIGSTLNGPQIPSLDFVLNNQQSQRQGQGQDQGQGQSGQGQGQGGQGQGQGQGGQGQGHGRGQGQGQGRGQGQSQNVIWTISGSNLMVEARPGVMCLAFVNGGVNPQASVVIGAYQLQDNLLHFDMTKSSVGFRRANCASFNFGRISNDDDAVATTNPTTSSP